MKMQKGRFSTKGEVCLFDGRREVSWCRVNVKYTLEKDLSQKKEYIYYQLIYFTIVQCLVKRLLKRQTSAQIKKENSTFPPLSGIMSYTTGINSYKPLYPPSFYRILFIQVPAAA